MVGYVDIIFDDLYFGFNVDFDCSTMPLFSDMKCFHY